MRLLVLINLFAVTFSAETNSKDDPILNLPGLGKLRGKTIKTKWSKREVKQFLDVKYAESPTGVYRFKPPMPIQPWQGIKNANEDGIGCPTVLSEYIDDPFGSYDIEDCLSMTISSGNLSAKQPVMVYLHGEYLYEGNNLEGAPEYLLEKDICLVSVQYRLGPFGFLSTNTPEIPGNAAVSDVILALQWIKHFIPYFGCDPSRVTLFGQVGGAAIAHLLTFSPVAPKGLFHRVIYHSGSALMPAFLSKTPVKFAKDIGEKAGCPVKNIEDLNICLLTLPAKDVLKGFIQHAEANVANGVGNFGGVQFTIGGPSGFLPEHPSIMLLEERNFSIPSMGGAPRNAGTRILKETFDADFSSIVPDDIFKGEDYINHLMLQSFGQDESGILTTFLTREFFTTDILRNGTFKAMLPGLIDLVGTVIHKVPVLMALKRNAKHMPNKTFLYSFDYQGEFNRYPDFDENFDVEVPFKGGVSLTDENIYLFPYPEHVEKLNKEDTDMAKKMVELWTSFAATGEPAVNWPPMKDLNGPYIKIDRKIRIGHDYFDEFSATLRNEKHNITLVKAN